MSKKYDMINKFDLRLIIKQTLITICKKIDLPKTFFILYTNSYLLYQYLIQLKTTNKKQLIIDIMILS